MTGKHPTWRSALLFLLFFLPSQAPAFASSLKEILTEHTRSFMDAWRNEDMRAVLAAMAPQFVYVGPEGVVDSNGVTQTLMPQCRLISYTIEDVQLHTLTNDSASILYKLHQDAICNGHPLPSDMTAVDTYVNIHGKWMLSQIAVSGSSWR